MKIYMSGIGGIGMSALAQMILSRAQNSNLSLEIVGSDNTPESTTDHLQKLGVKVHFQQRSENLDESFDLLVYSEAISPDHPERKRAMDLGIPQKSYFEYLGELSEDYRVIAVAGTHGKTTTTAMIGEAMVGAGMDPTIVVGSGVMFLEGRNFRAGKDPWLVVEACEYRNNFQFLSPEIVILTNIEWDHPDSFPTEASYKAAFKTFCEKAQRVICHEEAKLELSGGMSKDLDLSLPQYQIPDASCQVILKVPGAHNRENAQLAMALGIWLRSMREGDPSSQAADQWLQSYQKALENFSGTARRQEYIGDFEGRPCFDDYGHHPTEIRATMQAFSERFPDKTVALVFQPHQYSRTRHLLVDFQAVLRTLENVALVPIYQVRDNPEDLAAVSIQDLAGENGTIIENAIVLQNFIRNLPQSAVIVFMGAGDISKRARQFLAHGEF